MSSHHRFNVSEHLVDFLGPVLKPICRPNAVQLPASAVENFFAQPVAVAGRFARMVRRAVALDPQKECSRLLRILNS